MCIYLHNWCICFCWWGCSRPGTTSIRHLVRTRRSFARKQAVEARAALRCLSDDVVFGFSIHDPWSFTSVWHHTFACQGNIGTALLARSFKDPSLSISLFFLFVFCKVIICIFDPNGAVTSKSAQQPVLWSNHWSHLSCFSDILATRSYEPSMTIIGKFHSARLVLVRRPFEDPGGIVIL